MAGVKISQLPAIVTPALTDIFPVTQAGTTYKETGTQLVALLSASFLPLSSLPLAVLSGGTGVTTSTGTGNTVLSTSPTLVTPALGTIASGNLAAGTGYLVSSLDDVAYTAFVPGFTGFSANPTGVTAFYKKIGKSCFIYIDMTAGTSNATGFTITGLPFTAGPNLCRTGSFVGSDNSAVTSLIYGFVNSGSTILTITLNDSSTGWTNAGTKGIRGQFFYETV